MSIPPQGKFGVLSNLLNQNVASGVFDTTIAKRRKQKRYFTLMRGLNVSSYSTFGSLDTCERLFAINKLTLARYAGESNQDNPFVFETNMDLAFGKAMETGVQDALLGKTKQETFMDMFMSWDMPLDAIHPKGYPKTFIDASIAIDKFYWVKDNLFYNEGWEIAWFNGKPAIELAFCIDLENGYYYVGHADIILYNPSQRIYRVLENKTTAFKNVHEAMYKNSDQAVGYSVVLDSIAKDKAETTTFEVFYLVYSTAEEQFKLFNFTKSRSTRASWLNTILFDYQRIELCKKTGFWPKRGSSCFNWNRPCKYYDLCDLSFDNFNTDGEFDYIDSEEMIKHEFDFRFTLKEIIQTQEDLI